MNHNEEMFPYNIALIGFMGTGKSTLSKYLKEKYGMDIVEMDQEIADQEGMSIPDIFAAHGEEYFRNLETALLVRLQSRKNTVISCGGGVAMREENVRELKKNGYIVLLTASPQTIYERVKYSDDRPILNGNKNVEYIAELMEKRRKKYEAAADVVIRIDHKTAQQISEEMMRKLKELE